MLSMIKFNMFDAICHEHLMYLSSKIMIKMAQNNKLEFLILNITTSMVEVLSILFVKILLNLKIIKKILLVH